MMLSGNIEPNILLPSNGGIGKMLNTAKTKLITTAFNQISPTMPVIKPNLIGNINNTAKIKLLKGPTTETKAIPNLRGLRLLKFTGTGLAAPNTIGLRTSNKNPGNKIEPNG